MNTKGGTMGPHKFLAVKTEGNILHLGVQRDCDYICLGCSVDGWNNHKGWNNYTPFPLVVGQNEIFFIAARRSSGHGLPPTIKSFLLALDWHQGQPRLNLDRPWHEPHDWHVGIENISEGNFALNLYAKESHFSTRPDAKENCQVVDPNLMCRCLAGKLTPAELLQQAKEPLKSTPREAELEAQIRLLEGELAKANESTASCEALIVQQHHDLETAVEVSRQAHEDLKGLNEEILQLNQALEDVRERNRSADQALQSASTQADQRLAEANRVIQQNELEIERLMALIKQFGQELTESKEQLARAILDLKVEQDLVVEVSAQSELRNIQVEALQAQVVSLESALDQETAANDRWREIVRQLKSACRLSWWRRGRAVCEVIDTIPEV
jgi:hypothetical protein